MDLPAQFLVPDASGGLEPTEPARSGRRIFPCTDGHPRSPSRSPFGYFRCAGMLIIPPGNRYLHQTPCDSLSFAGSIALICAASRTTRAEPVDGAGRTAGRAFAASRDFYAMAALSRHSRFLSQAVSRRSSTQIGSVPAGGVPDSSGASATTARGRPTSRSTAPRRRRSDPWPSRPQHRP